MRSLTVLLVALSGCVVHVPMGSVPASSPSAPPHAPRRGAPALSGLPLEVHVEANQARRRQRVHALAWSPRLAAVAGAHSRDMARRGFFDHVSPDGAGPQDRVRRGGAACHVRTGDGRVRTGVAENLYRTTRYASRWERRRGRHREVGYDWMSDVEIAEATVQGWLGSPGHRRNLLERTARSHGVGVAVGRDHRVYVTQVLC